jgi:hypothetical protein
VRPEPICDASRMRCASPVSASRSGQRWVVEADVVQELEARHDLLDDLVGDRGLEPSSVSSAKKVDCLLERPRGDLVDRALRSVGRLAVRASRLRRVPWHSGHGLLFRSSGPRAIMLSVSR